MELKADKNKWVGTMSQKVAMLALTTRNVSKEKENLAHVILTQFASRLDSLAFLLKEMQRDAELRNADYKKLENGKLGEQVEAMESFLDSYTDKCKLYLLSSCPHIMKQVQIISKTWSDALDSVLQNAGCTAMKLRIAQVKEGFESATPKLDAKQHSILDALEPEMLDSVAADSGRCTKLVQQIAESFEMSLDSEPFQKELSRLKEDKESVENAKGNAQALYLEQFLTLLEKGVVAKSKPRTETGAVHVTLVREVTMRSTPLTPLQSFICPITRDVMRDPVQIASGQTFEREAIERWFAEGHSRCPLGTDLKNTKMKSNIALRQSISEWRDRNFEIRIQDAGDNLQSLSLEDQGKAVQELQRICEEYNMNKYTIASKGLIQPLVRLAETKNHELRTKTVAALRTLAEENEENQEIMVKEGVLDMLVRCLARKREELEQAVLLLRILSKRPSLAEKISHAHGAVLLLVTLLGNEDEETAAHVKEILENLPANDDNTVIMAEANFMDPLVTRLVEGSQSSKLVMASTLAHLQMPDTSKIQTATQESISTLMKMAQSKDEKEKVLALEALRNLTTVREVCLSVAKAKPSGPEVLVPLLHSTTSSIAVRTSASNVMANLMTSLGDSWEPALGKDQQVEKLVSIFLSFYFPSRAQAQVFRGLLGLVNGKDTGDVARKTLIDRDALNLLGPLLKFHGVDPEVRKYAVQIFACLSGSDKDGAAAALKKEGSGSVTDFLSMLQAKDTKLDVEKLAAMTILANLPLNDASITVSLLQADCIPLLVKYLSSRQGAMQEEAAGALLRFTTPSGLNTIENIQQQLAEQDVVQRFVTLLDSNRSLTQERAAKALTNFSKCSSELSVPIPSRSFFTCFSPKVETCSIHRGICKIETSFCLKEAEAVPALLTVLKEGEPSAAEAAIETLLTLVDDDYEPGVHLIARCKGIPMMINVLSTGTRASQEMGVILLEKVFKIPEYRQLYGSILQMHIITVVQRGSQRAKQVAGRVLRQLDLLHSQSYYFVQSQ